MAWSWARPVAVVAMGLLATLATIPPAWPHGEGEATEGYLLVQQALGHLAHDSSMAGIDAAMEKVDDALMTDDQEGVDVANLEQAEIAMRSGEVDRARRLLQDSIRQALAALPPATGAQTGTHVVPPELPGRPDLRVQDWVLLAASALALTVGVWLAFVFRPRDTIRTLRSRMAKAPPPQPRDGWKRA